MNSRRIIAAGSFSSKVNGSNGSCHDIVVFGKSLWSDKGIATSCEGIPLPPRDDHFRWLWYFDLGKDLGKSIRDFAHEAVIVRFLDRVCRTASHECHEIWSPALFRPIPDEIETSSICCVALLIERFVGLVQEAEHVAILVPENFVVDQHDLRLISSV